MIIKTNKLLNTQRTVAASLEFEEEGERKSEAFKVVYRALSPKMMRELQDASVGEDNRVDIVKYLTKIVVALPEVIGEDEQPITPSEELFESIDSRNLKSIFKAIQDDISPND